MSTLLDAESVVIEVPTEALPCIFHSCSDTANWEWLMDCGCVWTYCHLHHLDMLDDYGIGYYICIEGNHGRMNAQVVARTRL